MQQRINWSIYPCMPYKVVYPGNMGFYDLSKPERALLVETITQDITDDLYANGVDHIHRYFSDQDTYIRKAGYQTVGKIYNTIKGLRSIILKRLDQLIESELDKVRQTAINAAGEIGKTHFEMVEHLFNKGLFDHHHSVRNAMIGSLKKMSEKNPQPTLKWAKRYLDHPDQEVRREICHGIELRGRTHPQDILPMLAQLQNDQTKPVQKTLVHVIGQISYKQGCLITVVNALNTWTNRKLVANALDEIVDVHRRYENFAALSQQQAIAYIDINYEGKYG